MLIAFALLGAVCSLSIGWLTDLSLPLLLAITAIYGFAAIGDSSVLSSAMTDAVPAKHLGRILGLRSVLGVGAGSTESDFQVTGRDYASRFARFDAALPRFRELLAKGSGVATFRWRLHADEDYRVHAWRLDDGIADLRDRGLFPIE